jgi:hypothetical protein
MVSDHVIASETEQLGNFPPAVLDLNVSEPETKCIRFFEGHRGSRAAYRQDLPAAYSVTRPNLAAMVRLSRVSWSMSVQVSNLLPELQ